MPRRVLFVEGTFRGKIVVRQFASVRKARRFAAALTGGRVFDLGTRRYLGR